MGLGGPPQQEGQRATGSAQPKVTTTARDARGSLPKGGPAPRSVSGAWTRRLHGFTLEWLFACTLSIAMGGVLLGLGACLALPLRAFSAKLLAISLPLHDTNAAPGLVGSDNHTLHESPSLEQRDEAGNLLLQV